MTRIFILLVLCGMSLVAVPAVDQHKHCDNDGGLTETLDCSFASTPTVGDVIRVACIAYVHDADTIQVTDNQTNSYASAVNKQMIFFSFFLRIHVYYAYATTSSGTFTVTCDSNAGGATYIAVFISELSGLATSSALDQTATEDWTGTSFAIGPVTTTVADEIVFGTMACDTATTYTAGTGFTLLQNVFTGIFYPAEEYKVVSSADSYPADGTVSSSCDDGIGVIDTYEGPAGAVGAAKRRVIL